MAVFVLLPKGLHRGSIGPGLCCSVVTDAHLTREQGGKQSKPCCQSGLVAGGELPPAGCPCARSPALLLCWPQIDHGHLAEDVYRHCMTLFKKQAEGCEQHEIAYCIRRVCSCCFAS